ncbi:SsrA-binding protein SmpB [SAR92 clade bacterium H455]|uniref:SsrA-binding protein n=1 Tax=SAR92 clade bacterium H455 TaxID=2974818 RepID=A0ABY5TQR3_9GAMM|nr:Small protein B [Gammaproteobacteria bacterium MOLA455]UVW34826.1 SsrA-binding protein SmpB [SAR92 clade bacterium H455]
MTKKKPKAQSSTIALNKKAKHNYFLEQKFEAGISLMGWEVKSLREGKVNLTDTYVLLQNGEAWLIGTNITPLATASTHYVTEPIRSRKLLLNRRELDKLEAGVNQKGYTCVCTAMYWKTHLIKVEIALAKGKADFDKRNDDKERDWDRQKQRIMRHSA